MFEASAVERGRSREVAVEVAFIEDEVTQVQAWRFRKLSGCGLQYLMKIP